MSKGARPTVFVCASVSGEGNLITQIITASTPDEASQLFSTQYAMVPSEILGPFFRKRTLVLENTRTLKFTNQSKNAVYNDWLVNAFFLKEPENQAYLVFLKRVDGKKLTAPKGVITVPISELRFVDVR